MSFIAGVIHLIAECIDFPSSKITLGDPGGGPKVIDKFEPSNINKMNGENSDALGEPSGGNNSSQQIQNQINNLNVQAAALDEEATHIYFRICLPLRS